MDTITLPASRVFSFAALTLLLILFAPLGAHGQEVASAPLVTDTPAATEPAATDPAATSERLLRVSDPASGYSSVGEGRDEARESRTDMMGVSSASNFETRGLNYFITNFESAPGLGEGPNPGYLNQAKFRISIRYRVIGGGTDNDLESGLYFGYRQMSFWHLFDFDRSSPFYDNSYRPGGYLRLSRFDAQDADKKRQSLIPSLEVGFFHESNGRGGLTNRSLNQVEINGWLGMPGRSRYAARASAYPLVSRADENADINDEIGRAEVGVFAAPSATSFNEYGAVSAFITSRVWGETFFRNVEANVILSFPRSDNVLGRVGRVSNLSVIVQYFYGYGENLIDYNELHNSFRFGVAFLL